MATKLGPKEKEEQREFVERALREMGLEMEQLAERLDYPSLKRAAYGEISLPESRRRHIQDLVRLSKIYGPNFGAVTAVTPREKLRSALKRVELSVGDLAKRIDLPISELQEILEGRGEISEMLATKICKELPELCSDDLLGGSDSPRIMDEAGTTGTYGGTPKLMLPPGMKAQFVPLLSYAQAGAMTEWSDEFYTHEAVLAVDLPPGVKAFALPLRGDSMEPRFREGDVAVVLYQVEPHNGEVVVACKHSGEVMCKIFTEADSGRRVQLTSYNERYHPPINMRRSDLRWVYPVHSVVQKLRR